MVERIVAILDQRGENRNFCRIHNGVNDEILKIIVECYGNTVVIADHSAAGNGRAFAGELAARVKQCVLYKWRYSKNFRVRNGEVLNGADPDRVIVENGVEYAINLTLNQDNSFYGDTRNLRKYLLESSAGKRVLNTFAYTGSLGVAALAGGAREVVQSDLSGKFLSLAARSLQLNQIPVEKMTVVEGNFFPVVSHFKKTGEEFDTVILDPPFFSKSSKGTVDLLNFPVALVNKVRPIVTDGGEIIMVNNALYLAGKDFLAAADQLCDGKYLTREKIINIPNEFISSETSIADPTPFNHPTKIITFRCCKKK